MSEDNLYNILGTDLQYIVFNLPQDSSVVATQESLMYKDAPITSEFTTNNNGRTPKQYSFLKKVLYGRQNPTILVRHTNANLESYTCAIAPNQYGRILPIELHGDDIIYNKEAFLCNIGSLGITGVFDQKLPSQNDQPYVHLERITGQGTVFFQSQGIVLEKELSYQETVIIGSNQNILAFSPGVKCLPVEEKTSSKLKKILRTRPTEIKLVGPGTIWLQTPFLAKINKGIEQSLKKTEDAGKQTRRTSVIERIFT